MYNENACSKIFNPEAGVSQGGFVFPFTKDIKLMKKGISSSSMFFDNRAISSLHQNPNHYKESLQTVLNNVLDVYLKCRIEANVSKTPLLSFDNPQLFCCLQEVKKLSFSKIFKSNLIASNLQRIEKYR